MSAAYELHTQDPSLRTLGDDPLSSFIMQGNLEGVMQERSLMTVPALLDCKPIHTQPSLAVCCSWLESILNVASMHTVFVPQYALLPASVSE